MSSVVQGNAASLLLLLQLGSRLVTFSLNQALLSLTTPAAFGTATIQLEPLLNTLLFLSREGIRSALVRSATIKDSGRALFTTSLIPLALGVPLSLAAFTLYAYSTANAVRDQPYFTSSVWLYAFATLIELGSEPFFNRAQVASNFKLRVSIEGTSVIARAVTTLLVILYGRDRLALLAFGVGQMAYAITLFIRYVFHYRKLLIGHSSESGFDKYVLKLAYALTKQSLFKQLLTEGDKIIVSSISPIEDQGGYALALNYGSLVARILFQPLEEASRLFYSQALVSEKVEHSANEAVKRNLEESLTLLKRLIKLQIYVSLIFTCFGPFYTTPLMYYVLGRARWTKTNAPLLLQDYLFLLPFLGMNGILEAFVQAVATEKELGRLSFSLLVWSGIYCTTCYISVTIFGMHEEALILANGITMACRIVYSLSFIDRFFRNRGTEPKLVSAFYDAKGTILACLLATIVIRRSAHYFVWQTLGGFTKHVLVGGVCFLICLTIGVYSERLLLNELRIKYFGRSKKTSKRD